jgi:hypothetical protein
MDDEDEEEDDDDDEVADVEVEARVENARESEEKANGNMDGVVVDDEDDEDDEEATPVDASADAVDASCEGTGQCVVPRNSRAAW